MKPIFLPVCSGIPITQIYGAVGQTDYYSVHYGIDYGAGCGEDIYATDKGIVTYAGWADGYGNMVKIRHDWGYSIYGHMSAIKCRNNDIVEVGQVIGLVGTTGWSTGCHLHFECRDQTDRVFNQTEYITENKQEVIGMLTFEQVRKGYLSILRREPDGGHKNVYVGSPISLEQFYCELGDSGEHIDRYNDSEKYRAGQTGDIKYEKVTEELYRTKK
jgi:murein DD-endopeptidase MepM/ murein hydrolase activator NlpD